MQVARCHQVASVAVGSRPGKCRAHSLPPHRITGELDRSCHPAHVGDGRAERLGDHLQRRDIDQLGSVRRVCEPNERKQSVDTVEARLFLIAFGDLQNLQSALRPESGSNFIGALGDRRGTGIPGRADGKISVDDGDVAETDPGSPTRLLDARARNRVAGEDPLVVPFCVCAGLPVEYDDGFYKLHIVEFELLASKRAEVVPGPDLVRFDEWRASTVGDHDIVQRDSVQEISADAADVDDAVAVVLNQIHDVASHALATPIAVGDQEGGAEQQQRHHRNHCEEAHPPPTH